MRQFIYKYDLPVDGDEATLTLRLPEGAQVLCVQVQKKNGDPNAAEIPRVWVKLDPLAKKYVQRKFVWFGTGQPITESERLNYIGTVQTDGGFFVWHLFERS